MAGPPMAHSLSDTPALSLAPHPPPSHQPQPLSAAQPPTRAPSHPTSLNHTPSPSHVATHSRPSPQPSAHPATSLSLGDTNTGSIPHHLSSTPSGDPSPSRPSAAGTGPTNDDIEAVIQMAMASSNSPRTTNPPRDTRTQLFVGNVRPSRSCFLSFAHVHLQAPLVALRVPSRRPSEGRPSLFRDGCSGE
ncbi:hypothetical protein C2E23DRAFT_196860 [Lenzites betulinus]|nr:hypothetical protein C2E23DRAFT_196860 [Lenzites betulinus]